MKTSHIIFILECVSWVTEFCHFCDVYVSYGLFQIRSGGRGKLKNHRKIKILEIYLHAKLFCH